MIDGQHLITDLAGELAPQLDDWQGKHRAMGLLVLLPEANKTWVPKLQAACRERGIPLFGAIFPMLITSSGFSAEGAWLLRFDKAPGGFLLPDATNPAEAADGIAAEVTSLLAAREPATGRLPTLFLIFDGMLPAIGSILTRVYRKLQKRVCYVGVNAGSETFQAMPCLFDGERIVGNGVLGLLPATDMHHVVEHDYPVSQTLMRATSASGNRVDSIDGRPAFDVYRDISLQEFGAQLTHENFYDHAVHYPLGVVTAADVLVRIPVGYGDDGSVHCVGEIPPNSMLRLLRAPPIDECDCVRKVAAKLEGSEEKLVFYCAGRRMHFGPDATREVAALAEGTGAQALAGALSLGEIDTMPEVGIPRFHNAALVCIHHPIATPQTA